MSALDGIPRLALAHLPTPLERADRLRERLGGPRLWLKRDDCTGLATGGNKTRKLEFLLADARAKGADTVITFGALQSNHARQTAAACARVGLACELVLSTRVAMHGEAYERAGNVQLDGLCGARIHRVAPAQAEDIARARIAALRAEGRVPYAIPAGGSNAVGALGYVACYEELATQLAAEGIRPVAIVHATSSGGTQAGLVAGAVIAARAGLPAPPIVGVNTYARDGAVQEATIRALTDEVLARLGHAPAPQGAVTIVHDYLGDDYGLPTPAMRDAVRLLARAEGVLLDPVYSGKAMAGLVDLVRRGRFGAADDVVFLHTGGAAALGAYWDYFATENDA